LRNASLCVRRFAAATGFCSTTCVRSTAPIGLRAAAYVRRFAPIGLRSPARVRRVAPIGFRSTSYICRFSAPIGLRSPYVRPTAITAITGIFTTIGLGATSGIPLFIAGKRYFSSTFRNLIRIFSRKF
jgi:hypothetical protein